MNRKGDFFKSGEQKKGQKMGSKEDKMSPD